MTTNLMDSGTLLSSCLRMSPYRPLRSVYGYVLHPTPTLPIPAEMVYLAEAEIVVDEPKLKWRKVKCTAKARSRAKPNLLRSEWSLSVQSCTI